MFNSVMAPIRITVSLGTLDHHRPLGQIHYIARARPSFGMGVLNPYHTVGRHQLSHPLDQ